MNWQETVIKLKAIPTQIFENTPNSVDTSMAYVVSWKDGTEKQAEITGDIVFEAGKQEGMQKVIPFAKKFLELAEHGDYSNGNAEGGLDEGRVLARRLLDDYEKEWQKFLKDEGLEG